MNKLPNPYTQPGWMNMRNAKPTINEIDTIPWIETLKPPEGFGLSPCLLCGELTDGFLAEYYPPTPICSACGDGWRAGREYGMQEGLKQNAATLDEVKCAGVKLQKKDLDYDRLAKICTLSWIAMAVWILITWVW